MIKQIASKDIEEYVKNNPKCVLLDVRTNEEWKTDGQPDGDKIGFGYQGKLGVTYEASNSFDLFVEGVYQSTLETEISGDYIDPISNFSTRLGTRFMF